MTAAPLPAAYASLMALRANKLATALLSASALLCSVAAFTLLFFPATTTALPVAFAPVATADGFDAHFWLFFGLMCGAAFSALAALVNWKASD